jgi:hypothetical protein
VTERLVVVISYEVAEVTPDGPLAQLVQKLREDGYFGPGGEGAPAEVIPGVHVEQVHVATREPAAAVLGVFWGSPDGPSSRSVTRPKPAPPREPG